MVFLVGTAELATDPRSQESEVHRDFAAFLSFLDKFRNLRDRLKIDFVPSSMVIDTT